MFVIAGKALDPFGNPVAGTLVTVHDRITGNTLGITTASPETGKFVFENIATGGEVYVTITFPGREPQVFDQVDPLTFVRLTTQNQFVVNICDPLGSLDAVVDGDITGHTILWEQIDGPTVVLSNADTLNPTFDNTPIGQTRVFRLTIDEGTCLEQVGEYTISGRPQSNSEIAAGHGIVGTHYHQPQNDARSRKDFDVSNFRLVPRGWTPGADDYVSGGECPVTNFWYQFDPPTFTGRVIAYEVQQFSGGQWGTIQVIPVGGLTVFNVTAGAIYRVCVVIRRSDYTQTRQCSLPRAGRVEEGNASGLSIHERLTGVVGQVSNFSVSIPTRIVKDETSTNDRINAVLNRSTVKSFTLMEKGLDGSVSTTDDISVNNAGTRSFSIVRNNGSSIGT